VAMKQRNFQTEEAIQLGAVHKVCHALGGSEKV
jgi:hypothetical protein